MKTPTCKKKRNSLLNPYGESKSEFIEKYHGMRHIAEICWFFGLRPEELKDELERLLEKEETYEFTASCEDGSATYRGT